MSDWGDRTPDDEHSDVWRWNRAEREAERNPAPDLRPMFRRYILIEVPGLLILGVGLAVAVALLRSGDRTATDVGTAARWGLVAAALALSAIGIVHFLRSGPLSSNVLGVLTPAQRGRVRAQIRGRVPVASRELTVVRAAARERQAAAVRQAFSLTPTTLVLASQATDRQGLLLLVLLVILALVTAVVMGWWQYRQATAFLRRNRERDPSRIDESGE